MTIMQHVACKSNWAKCPCKGIDNARALIVYIWECSIKNSTGGQYCIVFFTLWFLPYLVKNCPFVNSLETKTLHLMQLQQKEEEI